MDYVSYIPCYIGKYMHFPLILEELTESHAIHLFLNYCLFPFYGRYV